MSAEREQAEHQTPPPQPRGHARAGADLHLQHPVTDQDRCDGVARLVDQDDQREEDHEQPRVERP
jgi:hypothetical protein